MPIVELPDLVPPPSRWSCENGKFGQAGFDVCATVGNFTWLLISPAFELTRDQLHTFCFSARFVGVNDYVFAVHKILERADERPHIDREIHSRLYVDVEGERRLSLAFRPSETGHYRLVLRFPHCPENLWGKSVPMYARVVRLQYRLACAPARIQHPKITASTIGAGRISTAPVADFAGLADGKVVDTELPHWGPLKRAIHRRCRNSRSFNGIVSAIEMRLGCEEVLSLPQYMALCPTGQCNALCDFCSVTVNRTGILKKQLPFNRLSDFVGPVADTIRLFGMEGNGEPTLYAYFPELVDSLTRKGAKAYLITNGSRLNAAMIPLLTSLDSVNFSLNAASAATHKQVMKLKNFDEITAGIRALVAERGLPGEGHVPSPQVSVSFVVTADNVHEVQEFLKFAEIDLAVDVIWIRPLSELANESGAVEDLRSIVPYESDIRDMIDSVSEYLSDTPRRSDIRIDPSSFNSLKSDPVDRVLLPKGFEGRLLPPRRTWWKALANGARLAWHLNSVKIDIPAAQGPVVATDPIDIEPRRDLVFRAAVKVAGGAVTLRIVDAAGSTLAEALLRDQDGQPMPLNLTIRAEKETTASIVIAAHGAPSQLEIQFERLRTPAAYLTSEFRVPIGRRWECCVPQAKPSWNGRSLKISSETGGGPYLLKSYAIACRRQTLVEVPVNVRLRSGNLTIGILSQDESRFLENFQFFEGQVQTSLVFDSEENERVKVLLSAEPGRPIDGEIQWLEATVRPTTARDMGTMPAPAQWKALVAGVKRTSDRIAIAWAGEGGPYLLSSGKLRCKPDGAVRLSLALSVQKGRIGIGALNAAGDTWLAQSTFGEGRHDARLAFHAGDDGRFSIVLFGVGDPARAEIDLNPAISNIGLVEDIAELQRLSPRSAYQQTATVQSNGMALTGTDSARSSIQVEFAPSERHGSAPHVVIEADGEPARERRGSHHSAATVEAETKAEAEVPLDADVRVHRTASERESESLAESKVVSITEATSKESAARTTPVVPAHANEKSSGVWRGIARWVMGRSRYYCQKPWTDLNSFSVDGRVDVCCIATGPSQERYQLGNLRQQGFQDIWNGPMARTFRRTVNSDPLPPCSRCPMLYAYQGNGFDPVGARRAVEGRIDRTVPKFLVPAARLVANLGLGVAFRGFRRDRRWL